MKLTFDFSELWAIANSIKAKDSDFSLSHAIEACDPIDTALADKGIEVNPEQVELTGGLFNIGGRQVVLYIPDHSNKGIEAVLQSPSEGKKFHITYCRHLDDMKRRKMYDRYRATNRLTGDFHIFGKSKYSRKMVEGTAALNVCMFCLEQLNYKGSANRGVRSQVRNQFDMSEFFSTYSSVFPHLPSGLAADPKMADYSAGWKRISAEYRRSRGYQCEVCAVNLSNNIHLLHTHHINGIKGDNREQNLQALCEDCHRREHAHMHVSHDNMQIINCLRYQQGIIQQTWESALRFADPALLGCLGLIKAQGLEAPIIGYRLASQGSVVELEAAWPKQHRAILVRPSNYNNTGWKMDIFDNVMKNITNFF